jgi:Glyoxalase/Bleomycin resistance protein/Dioxygenase superfamily
MRRRYRGEPTEADVALAMASAGHMLVELNGLNDDRPSVWREGMERQGFGFHHFGVGTLDYDADLARHLEQGDELGFECLVPTGGRVAYTGPSQSLPAATGRALASPT